MGTAEKTAQENPLERPLVRHGIGVSGALIVAFVAFAFLEGTIQLLAYGIALLDAIVTPQILRMAVEN
jgi:hypothetical protein